MSHRETPLYPLLFRPVFKDYVWGGRKLGDLLGRQIPDGIVAESWEIAAHPDGSSVVRNGALAGKTLPMVQEQWGIDLLGERNRSYLESGRFPLLIKLLDANRWLSVQVHPDDAYGLAHEDDLGKTEMWVILHAEAETELIFGFKKGVTKEQFAEALRNETVDQWLHRLPVSSGDVLYIPAGSIHALGPGALVAEIQQNSNTTYRIYDWGRPRPIHVAQALDVLNFELIEPHAVIPLSLEEGDLRREQLATCAYFTTERWTLPAGSTYRGDCDGGSYEIWALLEGAVDFKAGATQLTLEGVEWILLPAALGAFSIAAQTESTLLRVTSPSATGSEE